MTATNPKNAAPDFDAVRSFLLKPESYPEQPVAVELRETHISEVFVTDTRVYKRKKPVRFEFLDFSDAEKRKRACEDEVRLNRRLAPEVYLGVAAVTAEPDGSLAINGAGKPVDWLVKMRRLANDQSLLQRIESNKLTSTDVSRIAAMLTRFFRQQPPLSLKPDDYRRVIHEHVTSNRSVLLEHPDHFAEHVVKRVHTAQLLYLYTAKHFFDERVCDGRLIEGHGDLRPEHIFLAPQPLAIDCIEFNESMRQLDVLDELSFLAMECSALKASAVGEQIIDHYLNTSSDHFPAGMLEFYMTYRACVRMKVSLLQANLATGIHDEMINQAARYLSFADEKAAELGPPLFIVVRGLAGVGKSTLAAFLADAIGAEHFNTDVVRRKLLDVESPHHDLNQETYSPENRRRVYQAMFDRAARQAVNGISVVLDGTFLSNELQQYAWQIGTSLNARLMMVNCWCSHELAAQRIEERQQQGGAVSDADRQTHVSQSNQAEPPPTQIPQCEVDTSFAIATQAETVFTALAQLTEG